MDQPSPKALRKMRRRAENEALAKDARFWIGKIKSADRLGYKMPVNKAAVRELSFRCAKRRRKS